MRTGRLSAELQALIEGATSSITATDPAFGAVLREYLLHGENGSALGLLAADMTLSRKFFHMDAGFGHRRPYLYGDVASIPSPVLFRLGKALEAAHNGVLGGRSSAYKTDWFRSLVDDMAAARQTDTHNRLSAIPLSVFEGVLAQDGLRVESLVTRVFLEWHDWAQGAGTLTAIPGYSALVAAHPAPVRTALASESVEDRIHALEMLVRIDPEASSIFASDVAHAMTSSRKTLRSAANELSKQIGPALIDPLLGIADHGAPAERALAVRELWRLGETLGRADALEAVRTKATADPAATVRELAAQLVDFAASSEDVPSHDVPLPPAKSALSRASFERFKTCCEDYNTVVRKRAPGAFAPFTPQKIDALWAYIQDSGRERPALGIGWTGFAAFMSDPEVAVHHVLRLGLGLSSPHMWPQRNYFDHVVGQLLEAYNGLGRAIDLATVAAAFVQLGGDPTIVAHAYFSEYGNWARDWTRDQVLPFLVGHQTILQSLCDPEVQGAYWVGLARVYAAVDMFPTIPSWLLPQLFAGALGPTKLHRPYAQKALARFDGTLDRVTASLSNPKADLRTIAAVWLGKLKDQRAVGPLERALTKEKNDVAASAMLGALEALGAPIDRFVSRETLAAEAEAGRAKGIPGELAWMPWTELPAVRWADTGETIDPHVVQWLIVQACRLKSPEPSGFLRRYATWFDVRDRERLALFVFEHWIRADVAPFSPEEAAKRAALQVQQMQAMLQHYPTGVPVAQVYGSTSPDEVYAKAYASFFRTPAGSATASKGVLAFVSACGGAEVVPIAQRYLKEWYGTRAAQGKALIAMLAWMEHPAATQLMLSIGSRFRTKGFQDEATRQAELLAERKGWTVDELADRTIPLAGFDERGEIELSYGERRFYLRLDEKLNAHLVDDGGKTLTSLPAIRKEDDEQVAKDAKAALASSKKLLKSVIASQSTRLYEALCTERRWAYEDWERYLNGHPIVRRLCQRLVWTAYDGDALRCTFRPLDDGTLTDAHDEPVVPSPQSVIGIAHDSNLSPDLVAAWRKALADYEVAPLFEQFGRGAYALPQELHKAQELTDFRGHVLEAFSLRGRATKLGYQRGAAQDGGVFLHYEKRFPSLRITATIGFTGNFLPEENRTVALTELSFERSSEQSRHGTRMSLGEVPAILLSECWSDVGSIAASGSGFDPDWEKVASL